MTTYNIYAMDQQRCKLMDGFHNFMRKWLYRFRWTREEGSVPVTVQEHGDIFLLNMHFRSPRSHSARTDRLWKVSYMLLNMIITMYVKMYIHISILTLTKTHWSKSGKSARWTLGGRQKLMWTHLLMYSRTEPLSHKLESSNIYVNTKQSYFNEHQLNKNSWLNC